MYVCMYMCLQTFNIDYIVCQKATIEERLIKIEYLLCVEIWNYLHLLTFSWDSSSVFFFPFTSEFNLFVDS